MGDEAKLQCEALGYMVLEAYTGCLFWTMLKFVGWLVIICASLYQVPQLVKICRKGSVQGLSRMAAYSELICYFNTMAYARHLKLGLNVYAETIMIAAQNAIIVLAIFWYDRKIQLPEKMLFMGIFAMYAMVLLEDGPFMTEHAWHLIASSVIICSVLAHGSQFCENWKNRSTGQVAGGTVMLTFFTDFCRTVVVLYESDDFMYVL